MPGLVNSIFPRRIGIEPIGPPKPITQIPPRALLTGLIAQSRVHAQKPATAALITGVALKADWNAIQPVGLAALSASGLQAVVDDIDWAHGLGYKVRLRVFSGEMAPSNVVTSAGGMTWYSNDNPGRVWLQMAGQVPRWWDTGYHAAYQDFMSRLASAPITSTSGATVFGDHPALAEVCMSLGATDSAEPFIHQFAYADNRATALANGWTKDLDIATYKAGATAHAAIWNPYRVATYFPFNPYQAINPTTGAMSAISTATTIALMEDFVDKCERMAVVANNSLMNPIGVRGANYQAMYTRHISLRAQASPYPVPIAFQTATITKMKNEYNNPSSVGYQGGANPTTSYNTVDFALNSGATSVEIPTGSEDTVDAPFLLTPANATTFNAQFSAQSAPLLA